MDSKCPKQASTDVDSCSDAAKRSDYKSKLKRGMRRSDRNSISDFNFRGIIAYCLFDDTVFSRNMMWDVPKMIVLVLIIRKCTFQPCRN